MKYTRITALAALGVAATLSLTACGADDGGKDSSAKGSSASSQDGAEAGKGTEAQAGSADGTAAAKKKFCKTEDLAIKATDAGRGDAGRINVTMTNRGADTCSATGFPGVDIKDVDHTSSPIPRGKAEPRVTTLKSGDSAVFNLSYEIDPSGESLAHPTHLQVTPPNETHTVDLKWPAGAGAIKGAYPDVEVYPTHTTK